jgi:hypothetical protein
MKHPDPFSTHDGPLDGCLEAAVTTRRCNERSIRSTGGTACRPLESDARVIHHQRRRDLLLRVGSPDEVRVHRLYSTAAWVASYCRGTSVFA